MAVLGLRFCARAFSSCSKRGPLLIAVLRPLTIAASPVEEHGLQTRRLSNRGSQAQPLRGMWDPPRPGHEPVCPALAGRFSTTAPPGKHCNFVLFWDSFGCSGFLTFPCIAFILGAGGSFLEKRERRTDIAEGPMKYICVFWATLLQCTFCLGEKN